MGWRALTMSLLAAAAIGAALLAPERAVSQPPNTPGSPANLYATNCAGCHGTDLSGGRGPALFNPALLAARTDAQLEATVHKGIPNSEMPAFDGTLADNDIHSIVAYLRIRSATIKGPPAFVPDPTNQVVRSEKQAFRIEVVARGLDTPWGLAFLPDGRLLVTERAGRLRIIGKAGKLLPDPVKNTPKVWVRQDSGLLDVAVHPDYRRNGWIYLSYVDVVPGHVVTPEEANKAPPGTRQVSPPSMTVIIRGRINARGEWFDTQELFRAPAALYTPSGAHYGSRFLFDGKGHLFYSLGERGDMTNAQRLDVPLGKIHRINDDGTIPADNPFVKTPGAIPTIWSYGHRNPEGMAWDPLTGMMWETEHGPTGGDDVNIIEKGHNYGWGVTSMGIQPGITKREAPGMDQPLTYYTPSIGPSGISFYTGNRYPGWKNNLFVAALVGQKLLRFEVKGREIVKQETLFAQYGRTRAVITGPDGLLYVLLQNPTGAGTGVTLSDPTPGMVVRLVPVS